MKINTYKMALPFLALLCFTVLAQPASANTFVGNGGTSGDVELKITLEQIEQTFTKIARTQKVENLELCECPPMWTQNSICRPLNQLQESQRKFCQKGLVSVTPQVLDILKNNKAYFKWTHSPINVISHEDHAAHQPTSSVNATAGDPSNITEDHSTGVTAGGSSPTSSTSHSTMAADAVTNPKDHTITINKDNFLKASQAQRVFLLTHELMHLITFEDGRLTDQGTVGPFTSAQGQREFINAMASSIATEAHSLMLYHNYQRALHRSQSHVKNWVDLGFVGLFSVNPSSNTYDQDYYGSFKLNYRRYWNLNWGFNAGLRGERATEDVMSNTTIEEQLQVYHLGVSYRFFNNADPLTSWGQSFINIDLNFEYTLADLTAKDSFTSAKDDDSGMGLGLYAQYYYPLSNSFWIHLGVGVNQTFYKYNVFNLEKNDTKVSGTLGVSYGF